MGGDEVLPPPLPDDVPSAVLPQAASRMMAAKRYECDRAGTEDEGRDIAIPVENPAPGAAL
jgi:hypothetical protein